MAAFFLLRDEPVPIFQLSDDLVFPDPRLAHENGLLAVGGDLRPERILLAYRMGIFPWPSEGMPLLWWSPQPRLIVDPHKLHVPRSLRKHMRKQPYRITFDTAFAQVIAACARTTRDGQDGTWITADMQAAYTELHHMGFAHSAEAWQGDTLVGGLYGISLGGTFFGESMFARAPDASKMAFVTLAEQLARWSFALIDCQMTTEHLLRFGAFEVDLETFLDRLGRANLAPTRRGPWATS